VTSIPAGAASLLRTSSRAYAAAVVERLGRDHPGLLAGDLPESFARPIDDIEVRILHLAASVEFDRPALLEHAARWYKVAFHHRGVPGEYLVRSFTALAEVLAAELPRLTVPLVQQHLVAAQAQVASAPVELPSLLDPAGLHGRLAGHFLLAILEGRGDDAIDLVRDALAGGLSIVELHDHVLTPVQQEAGRMWLMGEISVADEHFGSVIVERALALVQQRLSRPTLGAPVVWTMGVSGNLHDLGLRIVAQRLQLTGFAVRNLGANMPPDDLELVFADHPADLVAISASMALQLHAVVETVAAVRRATAGRAVPVPVLVGGEPFRIVGDLHRLVGADASAVDGASAVRAAWSLLPA